MTEVAQRFGRNLRDAREARGWSQADLAKRAALTAVHVSRLERGVHEPRLTPVAALLRALDAKAEELIAGM